MHSLTPLARKLRRSATDAERRLWGELRDRRLLGFKFRRQRSIGRAVTDFTCESAKVVVELDGGQHEAETDAPRTARLSEAGYLVIRFWNNDVLQNLDGVLEAIAQTLGLGTDADGPPLP